MHDELPVHAFRLQHPRRTLLVEQSSEHRDEQIDDEELSERREPLAAEDLP
jgi:hypothetical protein